MRLFDAHPTVMINVARQSLGSCDRTVIPEDLTLCPVLHPAWEAILEVATASYNNQASAINLP